eukprot:TRINITY_DN37271_c0_g1_i1.p2 TRINITY_DN37271_c0_g1~~TRINITY_DN37271_c0_g1_i1.p2  ORF type:complete len:100 (+),score=9.68 TRINITY_DN37271_c0_g1_i1:97-396(+)
MCIRDRVTTVAPPAKSAPTTIMELHAQPVIVASMVFVMTALRLMEHASVHMDTQALNATRNAMVALFLHAVAMVAVGSAQGGAPVTLSLIHICRCRRRG